MVTNRQMTSRLDADGTLTVRLREEQLPEPTGH